MLIGLVNKLSMSSSALLLAEVQTLVGTVFFIGVCFDCLHALCRNSLAVHPGLSVDLNLKVLAEAARESALLLLDSNIELMHGHGGGCAFNRFCWVRVLH